jgi:hypothetical protein
LLRAIVKFILSNVSDTFFQKVPESVAESKLVNKLMLKTTIKMSFLA